jgi:4-amino-4-deoxy-L-arabinose transferase-like glycosyltransferase
MVVMFIGLAALVLSIRERSFRWLSALKPWLGLGLSLIVVLPWFVAIALKSHGEFFAASVGQDMLGKVGAAQRVHWAPPGFYLAAFFATFWPGAVLAAIAVPFAWANRRDDAIAFLLAWIVPSWIVFEVVPTKLPHYVMPLYPAVAILVILAVARSFLGPHRPLARISTILIPLVPIGLMAGLAAVEWSFDETLPFRALPVLLAASVVALYAWRLFVKDRVIPSILAGLVSSVFLALGVFGFAQLDLRSLKLSPRLAEVARNAACPNPVVATLGYREPSLVFLTGTNLEMLETGPEAAAFLGQGGCRIVFVDGRFETAFREEAEKLGLEPSLSTRVSGFNINSGRRVEIGAYSVVP